MQNYNFLANLHNHEQLGNLHNHQQLGNENNYHKTLRINLARNHRQFLIKKITNLLSSQYEDGYRLVTNDKVNYQEVAITIQVPQEMAISIRKYLQRNNIVVDEIQ